MICPPHDIAEMLEDFARKVEQLPGVSRNRPHAFAEAKSDVVHAMRQCAGEFRTKPAAITALPVGMIQPGIRRIGRREIIVERRRA